MVILVRPSPDTGKAKRETRNLGYKTFLNGILVSDIVTPRHRTRQPNALSFPAREALYRILIYLDRVRQTPQWQSRSDHAAIILSGGGERAGCHSSAKTHRSRSKRTVHSAEQPSERERDRYSRIRLFFDGVAQCPLKGTGGVGGAVDGLVIEILGGIRHFTGLFLGISNSTVEISAGSRGLWHISAPLESGLSQVNALKRAKVRRSERSFHRGVIRRGS